MRARSNATLQGLGITWHFSGREKHCHPGEFALSHSSCPKAAVRCSEGLGKCKAMSSHDAPGLEFCCCSLLSQWKVSYARLCEAMNVWKSLVVMQCARRCGERAHCTDGRQDSKTGT